MFAACAEHGVAVEVNSRPERLDPPLRLLRQAVAAGCSFTVDTDAHAPGQLDWLRFGCMRAAACEVPGDRVLNTWPVDRLLTWRADHGAAGRVVPSGTTRWGGRSRVRRRYPL